MVRCKCSTEIYDKKAESFRFYYRTLFINDYYIPLFNFKDSENVLYGYGRSVNDDYGCRSDANASKHRYNGFTTAYYNLTAMYEDSIELHDIECKRCSSIILTKRELTNLVILMKYSSSLEEDICYFLSERVNKDVVS